MTLLLISFIAGALTVLAPCILPILPVVIGGAVSDAHDKRKPFVITGALAVSVIVFTLLLKVTTLFIEIPQSFWTYFSGTILILMGLLFLFPSVWERLPINALLNSRSQQVLSKGNRKKSFWGDVMMGAALGPIFSTCSPTYFVILATVLPASFTAGMVYLMAYTLGLSIMLLAIAILGQRLVGRLAAASDPHGWVKRGIGLLILLVGVGIIFGLDKAFETALLDGGFFDVTQVEQRLLDSVE